jgi:hypothetical protein
MHEMTLNFIKRNGHPDASILVTLFSIKRLQAAILQGEERLLMPQSQCWIAQEPGIMEVLCLLTLEALCLTQRNGEDRPCSLSECLHGCLWPL